jgi:hypothetical protein
MACRNEPKETIYCYKLYSNSTRNRRMCVYLACTAVCINTLSHRCSCLESILYISEASGLAACSAILCGVNMSAQNTIDRIITTRLLHTQRRHFLGPGPWKACFVCFRTTKAIFSGKRSLIPYG